MPYINILNKTIPDNKIEIINVKNYISKLKKEYIIIKNSKSLSPKQYNYFHDKITNALYYVGSLSIPAFDIQDELKIKYLEKYKNTPELAKKLWQDDYSKIHKQYNELKNKLFFMIEKLDELYFKLNKSIPPL